MFIVFLKFGENKDQAGVYMQEHMAWIDRGMEDNVFLVVGSVKPNLGGGIIAYNTSLDDLQLRIDQDPFVQQKVVTVEIVELAPAKADARLSFLVQQ